jgi:multiple sugar transport system permease protein
MTRRWATRIGLGFFLPGVLLVVLITFFPILYAIWVSLHETRYLVTRGFIGLRYYVDFLVNDPAGPGNILKSLVYTFGSMVVALPLGLGLALALNHRLALRGVYRTLLIIPWVVSQVVTALLWSWLLNAQYGPVNHFVKAWFGAPFEFFDQPWSAMATLILTNVWRSFPYPMLLLLAALQGIPETLYEAAEVDGAGRRVTFLRITLPWLKSTFAITTIMLSLHYFNMITLPLVLTAGNPAGATEVMSIRTYKEALTFHHFGLGNAIAVYIFLFNALFSLVYLRVLKGEPQ